MTRHKTLPSLLLCASVFLSGCGSGGQKQNKDFFTSGDREADQRADQRMAKAQQLQGAGSGNGAKDASANAIKSGDPNDPRAASLFDRLGGQAGISSIVDDFVNRALADPSVNWERNGVKHGGFNWSRNKSVTWDASKYNVDQLKKHITQFLTLKTGGPAFYDGKEMAAAHANMHITNAEFDAAVGDLKATLDNLKVPNKEQKELLSIIESTRTQVATER